MLATSAKIQMSISRSRITADVHRIKFIALKVHVKPLPPVEGFNDWGGRGYDDFVPGEVTKTAPSGDEST